MSTSTVSTPASPPTPAPHSAETGTHKGLPWAHLLRMATIMMGVVIVLIPVYVLVITSFKGPGDATPARAWALPQTWTLSNWSQAWEALAPSILRSAQMVIPSTIISAVLGCMNGFVLSRWRFPGADIVFTLILFGMFLPYQAVMIPLQQLMISMNTSMPFLSGIPTSSRPPGSTARACGRSSPRSCCPSPPRPSW